METILQVARDPIWQFIGAFIGAIALIIGIIESRKRQARPHASQKRLPSDSKLSSDNNLPGVDIARTYYRHKKRKPDGILFANISSDFLNQFPVSIEALQNHVDRIYTPENFGEISWLAVFKRLIKEDYLKPLGGTFLHNITLRRLVNPGPKLDHWLRDTMKVRREILGLEDDEESGKPNTEP